MLGYIFVASYVNSYCPIICSKMKLVYATFEFLIPNILHEISIEVRIITFSLPTLFFYKFDYSTALMINLYVNHLVSYQIVQDLQRTLMSHL